MAKAQRPLKQTRSAYQGKNIKTTGKKVNRRTLKRKIAKYHMGRSYASTIGLVETAEYEALDYLMLQNGRYLLKQNNERMHFNFRRT